MRQRDIKRIEGLRFYFCRHATLGELRKSGVTLDDIAIPPGDPRLCIITDGKCEFDNRKCDAIKFRLVSEEARCDTS